MAEPLLLHLPLFLFLSTTSLLLFPNPPGAASWLCFRSVVPPEAREYPGHISWGTVACGCSLLWTLAPTCTLRATAAASVCLSSYIGCCRRESLSLPEVRHPVPCTRALSIRVGGGVLLMLCHHAMPSRLRCAAPSAALLVLAPVVPTTPSCPAAYIGVATFGYDNSFLEPVSLIARVYVVVL